MALGYPLLTMMTKPGRSIRRPLESAATWFLPHAHLALLVIALVIGILSVSHYGESWDEQTQVTYAHYGLSAYQHVLHGRLPPPLDAFMEQYGPAYVMLGAVLSSLTTALGATWNPVLTWHALDFVTFLGALELLYQFSRRWLSPVASFGTMLLFACQPLLWGHAFINMKDIPFTTLFLASVHLGFAAVDRFSSWRSGLATMMAAAAVLGLTISVRSGGPLAGLLVALYAAVKLGKRIVPFLAAYVIVASVVTFATWPYLWPAPAERFMLSLRTMSSFPFQMKTQFMGEFYSASALPWFYVPVIFGVQLTEPALALILAGLILAIVEVLRPGTGKSNSGPILLLLLGWTLLPIFAIIGIRGALYDNARQLFFLLPPLFLLAGMALDVLQRLVPSRTLVMICLGLLAVPGVWASVRLHPYEYVYYNSLAGGTGGAYGKFEMDYWATSYAEVADWLNQNAPLDSRVWIPGGPTYLVTRHLRPDLAVTCVSETDCGVRYDYYVALARLRAERRCRGAEIVDSVGRQGAVFSVVKKLPEGRVCR
jgi:hypothetical protein